MTIRTEDIVPGARLVTGRRVQCIGRDLSGIVSEFDVVFVEEDEEGLFFTNSGGARRRFEPNHDPYSSARLRFPHEVVWTLPVPEATDEELRRLAMATVGTYARNSSDKPWLLHVQSVSGNIAYALPVLPRGDDRTEGSLYPRDDGHPDYLVGNAAIWAHMVRVARKEDDWALRAGALVVLWPGKAEIVDGLPIHKARHLLDILSCSVERLGSWLPCKLSAVGYYTGPFHDIHEIEEEEERAHLRTQPNEALVFGYADGESRGSILLGTMGITFHRCDDILVNLFGMDDPELGLWVAEDVQWTGSGEDVEMESNLRPATAEDLSRFGWDSQSIRAEIAGHFDAGFHLVPEDVCEQGMLQAAEVAAVEAWETAIRQPWRDVTSRLQEATPRIAHSMRYPMEDFVSMAGSRLLAFDGTELDFDTSGICLRWPTASISIDDAGAITVCTPEYRRTYPRNGRVDRKDIFTPLVDWLASRPEHTERTHPNDPRTVVLVRDED